MKHDYHLTFETKCDNNDLRTSSNGSGTFATHGALPPLAQAGTSGHPANPSTPPVSSDAIPLIDRIGHELRTLREAEWRCLHERGGLIELKFTRRQKLVAVRLCNGVALAHVTAALRTGMKDRLPIAEDSRTVEIEPGLKTTFRFVRTAAWSPVGRGRR